ncbi:MAG: LPS export ABC transporter periplasmic protein LptC [Gammaproteobacteria bacterium]|nr:LPS export ABC transporter periplasmic protein LptC [Gammaproteobacteria bacterium]
MMLFNKKQLAVAGLFIFIILLSVWLIISTDRIQIAPNKDQNPTAFMNDVSIIRTNQLGQPNMKLETPKLTIYEKLNITKIDKPVVRIQNELARWIIHSDTGQAYDHPQKMIFEGHVHIQKYEKGQSPVIIETTQIAMDPEKSTAQTNQPVTITQDENIIHGIGLTANLKTGDVEILSHIQERYVNVTNGVRHQKLHQR